MQTNNEIAQLMCFCKANSCCPSWPSSCPSQPSSCLLLRLLHLLLVLHVLFFIFFLSMASPSNFNTCARASLSFWNLCSQFSYSSLTSLWTRSSTSSNFDAVCGRNELVICFTTESKLCLTSPVWWAICWCACLECIPRNRLSASSSSYETNEGLHMYIWG